MAADRAALAGNASYRENLPLTMKRKSFVEQTWFTFSYSPVRDETGAVAGMFCAVAETTAQVLAEQEARAERKVLADIVEGTDAFVQVCDMNYRWLAINKAAADEFARIFGVRPKVGQSMLDLLKDQPKHQDELKQSGVEPSQASNLLRLVSLVPPIVIRAYMR